jgi:3-phenylpropionate/trans-cinnamate dioxygenase ferredoxin component
MTVWIDVIAEKALDIGEHTLVDVDGTSVAVFRLDDGFYAIEDVCSHDGTEIAHGILENCEIICPRHRARFCIKTGTVKAPPAYEAIHSFPVRIEAGLVQLCDNR